MMQYPWSVSFAGFSVLRILQSFLFLFQTELQEIRNTVIKEIQPPADVSALISKMEFAHCIYLISVFRMESMRALYSTDPEAVHLVFRYLEERLVFVQYLIALLN